MVPAASKEMEVIIPGMMSSVRAAPSSAAIGGNQFAIEALETIRRIEHGEPVGIMYVNRLNNWMRSIIAKNLKGDE